MRELLNSGAVGSIELNAQKKIRQDIQERWEKLHLLEGLQGHVKETIATLYENNAKHLIYEATGSDNSGSFETVVFPLIRRVFSKLLANDIVSVQAMNLPIGKLFFIKPVTSEREWTYAEDGQISDGDTGKHVGLMGYKAQNRFYNGQAFDANDERTWETKNQYYLPDEVVKPAWEDDGTGTMVQKPEVTKYMKKSLYDLFYNDFLFDNSKGKVTIRVGNSTVVMLAPNGDYVAADLDDYPTDSNGSISSLLLEVTGFSSYNAGRLTGPDGNEMDTEAFLASLKVITKEAIDGGDDFTSFAANESIPFRVMTQKYGTQMVDYQNICDANGKLYIELDLTKPAKKQGQTMLGYIGVDPTQLADKQPDDLFKIAWAQYDSLELETDMGEVSFQLTSVSVSVEERKLRATWSPELAQDVSAFHNIDAEAELTAILYTQKDWNQTLMTQINKISAQIQKSTLRGGASFIVVSAEISAVLNDLEYFHVTDASAESMQYNMGIEKIGALQGRYQVIVDPYAPHWSLIMGHHGTSLLDTGYIYAPYVPMALTPTMYNPFNFAPVKGIVTRYAKKLVNNKYYGAIKVDGLTYWNINELR